MDISTFITSSGTLTSLLGTIAGYILSRTAKPKIRTQVDEISIQNIESEVDPLHNIIEKRLKEAKEMLHRQQIYARRNIWSMNSLVIGQYIVGGVLAIFFLQQIFTLNIVGLLGLLVLSSLIQQKFRPDIKALGAKSRARKLKSLLRNVEIEITSLKAGHTDAPSAFEISKLFSSSLDEIEKSEHDDLNKFFNEKKEIKKLTTALRETAKHRCALCRTLASFNFDIN